MVSICACWFPRETTTNPRGGCMQRRLSLALACCLGASVHAQTGIPDPSPELQRQDRQRKELRQQMEEAPAQSAPGPLTKTPVHQRLPDEQPCALIHRVLIQGVLFSEGLQSALSGINADDPPYGRCLGSQGVTLLIQRAQQALVEQGYVTSHVHVPEQDLNTGELLLQVNEGRVARIRAESAGVSLPSWVWAVREGDILNLRDVEQSAENLQRLPSLKTGIRIEPGEAPGTSDLVVDMQPGRPWRLGLSMDDDGLRTTGKLQGNATLAWDDPLGLGDSLSIAKGRDLGQKDSGPRGSRNQIVRYSLPWGYWLVGATFSDNRFGQTVYGPYESYLYSGTSGQKEFSLSRVLQRGRRSKTTASFKGFMRQSNNYIADLEVRVQRRRSAGWESEIQHLQYLQAGTLMAQLAYRRGTGAFHAQPAPEEFTGRGTARMGLTTGLLHWVMPLNTEGHPWQYSTQLQGQWTRNRLTPQDRFCLGSRATVRGFDGQQTVCGDRGQLWRQELTTGLPAALDLARGVQVYAALDAGRSTTPEQDRAHRLSGMALGLRGQHKVADADPVPYSVQWDVFLGKPLSRPEEIATAKRIAGFSLRVEF
ncbi:ShlB/FhaC/HecB family hemolysin secretion/activation protein [Verminephrobacter aporrectodeae subsp. tuberculatae]|nr:ShlB/FhaC/HecB family hemolysin secretion/activation protein [Verminephrobacter aporrectodeae subsp. tuberculatae]